MRTVKQILMQRDSMEEADADDMIDDFKQDLEWIIDTNHDPMDNFCEASELLKDYFGLEPDYLDEFLGVN